MPANTTPPPKLLEQLRSKVRVKHYSLSTEHQYVHWAKRFILFHGKRHPADMGAAEVGAFLAVDGQVSSSTQNQALPSLLFLYRKVLGQDLLWMQDMVRAKRPARLTAAWPDPGLPAAQPAPLLHAARFSHGSRRSVGSQRHAAPACRLVFGALGLAE